MIAPKELKQRIDNILGLCQTVNDLASRFDSGEYQTADTNFWEAVKALDCEAITGLGGRESRCVLGRLVSFGVKDNYARYIITKVNKKSVKLTHIPYMGAYHSDNVDADGECYREVVEDNVRWTDTVSEAFENKTREFPCEFTNEDLAMAL